MRVDGCEGSKTLVGPLVAAGVPATVHALPAGDVELVGSGGTLVGVEYKKLPDLLTCMRDGRFAGQLRKMRQRYEVCWLLIEGEWRQGEKALEVRERGGWRDRGHYTLQEVEAWLLTMAQRGGALLWRTHDLAETVSWLRALWLWWTAKEFEEHRAHLEWYTPPYTDTNPFDRKPPSAAQKVAAALLSRSDSVDVGIKAARAAAEAFGNSIRAMVAAGEKEWAMVEGVGARTARRVVARVRGEAEDRHA